MRSLGPRPAGLGDTDKLVDIESAAGKGLGDRVPAITACLSAARSDGDQADSALVRLIRKGTPELAADPGRREIAPRCRQQRSPSVL